MAAKQPKTGSRTVAGREIPPVGTWVIDPAHSEIAFVARHMMITKVRGRFREFTGRVHVAEAPEQSRAEVSIRASSIDTGDRMRDRNLRSALLDVERHPHLRFHSTSVRPAGHDRWEVTGDLTIRDVARAVTLRVEYCGSAADPRGTVRAGFLATTEIDRDDFDVTWNQALEAGGFLVGKGVKIELDVEAVLQAESPSPIG